MIALNLSERLSRRLIISPYGSKRLEMSKVENDSMVLLRADFLLATSTQLDQKKAGRPPNFDLHEQTEQ